MLWNVLVNQQTHRLITMFQQIRKFSALSSADKKLFLEAYMTLGLMRAAILTVSFNRLTRSLEQSQNKRVPPSINMKEKRIALRAGWAISRAANYTPWDSLCLVQSLTAQRMLQRRSIPGMFYLGVSTDESSEEKLTAHSWSQCGDNIITGCRGHETFTILSSFIWQNP